MSALERSREEAESGKGLSFLPLLWAKSVKSNYKVNSSAFIEPRLQSGLFVNFLLFVTFVCILVHSHS
jgi:hypothetical protein